MSAVMQTCEQDYISPKKCDACLHCEATSLILTNLTLAGNIIREPPDWTGVSRRILDPDPTLTLPRPNPSLASLPTLWKTRESCLKYKLNHETQEKSAPLHFFGGRTGKKKEQNKSTASNVTTERDMRM